MHELAIAELVAGIARDHAAGRRVRTVRMRVGRLRQVVPSALEQGFALVTRDTSLEGAALAIESVPIAGRCRRCDAESEQQEFPFRCLRCGSLALQVVRGEELQVDALDLEDEPAPRRAPAASGGRGHTREVTA